LKDGENGLVIECGDSPERYAEGVAALLLDPNENERLASGARSSAQSHTVEAMIENFSAGIIGALSNAR
jgi:glycosyltransferase involved in cell wall biosynthesis